MRIREAVKPWPPNNAWTVSYQGAETTIPDIATAVVHSARADREGVFLTITEGDRQFSTVLLEHNSILTRQIAKALSSARGKTLDEAGDLSLEG